MTRRHGESEVWQSQESSRHRVVFPAAQSFLAQAAKLGITVVEDEPLARHTTFRIGGPADLYAAATSVAQLERLVELAAAHDLPVTLVGGGSNILVSDAGVRGLVIANQTREVGLAVPGSGLDELARSASNCDALSLIRGELVAALSGVPLAGLARWAMREGWSGLEWAVSVPGTVGGAVIGNAGAHGGDIAGNLAWALVTVPGVGRRLLMPEELAFSYRNSSLKQRLSEQGGTLRADMPIVLAAAFRLGRGDREAMNAVAESYLARRRATQPVEPSAGSVFRNPVGDYAGRLIEAVGLKGQRCGGAQISPRHANFIINTGEARAADVLALMTLARRRVFEQFDITLYPEILLVGEWSQYEM